MDGLDKCVNEPNNMMLATSTLRKVFARSENKQKEEKRVKYERLGTPAPLRL